MDIDTVSVDLTQSSAPEPPPQRVEEQPAPVDTSSAQTISDPNLGQTVNILD